MTNFRSALKVIDGGQKLLPKWIDFPQTVFAKAPFKGSGAVLFRVSRNAIMKYGENNRVQPILDFWGCVEGQCPPAFNVEFLAAQEKGFLLSPLADAYACFRGIKRPLDGDDHGFDVIAYVTKPKWSFEWQPDMKGIIKPIAIPSDLVFISFVRLDPSTEDNANWRLRIGKALPSGIIVKWGFYEADKENTQLPVDFKERFRRQLW